MSGWMVWLIVLFVLVLIGLIRIGIHVLYEEKKLRLELVISRFKLVLIGKDETDKPKKPKKKKESKPKKDKPAKEVKTEEKPKKKGNILQNPWVQAVLEYWREIFEIIGRVLTMPTLDVLRLEIWVGGGDAEKCALTYGRICAIVGGALPVVENTFGIRKRKINVWCCYDRDSLDVAAEAAITVRVYEVFALIFALLGLGIKILIKAIKLKKAVQYS